MRRNILSNIWQSAAFPYIKEARKAAKLQKTYFSKPAILILTVSMNAFHSPNISQLFHEPALDMKW